MWFGLLCVLCVGCVVCWCDVVLCCIVFVCVMFWLWGWCVCGCIVVLWFGWCVMLVCCGVVCVGRHVAVVVCVLCVALFYVHGAHWFGVNGCGLVCCVGARLAVCGLPFVVRDVVRGLCCVCVCAVRLVVWFVFCGVRVVYY